MTMLRCADMLNLTHPAHRLCLLPDYSWAKQGRVTRPGGDLRQVVIPGCASWRRPGIHTPDRGYGFRARSPSAKLMLASILPQGSRPGMTTSRVEPALRVAGKGKIQPGRRQ